MDAMPLECLSVGGARRSLSAAWSFTQQVGKREVRAGYSDVVLIWLVALLNYIFGVLYSTVYFYFTPFIPLAIVIYQSHAFRHVPEASADFAKANSSTL